MMKNIIQYQLFVEQCEETKKIDFQQHLNIDKDHTL
jgi:hypothetical protein